MLKNFMKISALVLSFLFLITLPAGAAVDNLEKGSTMVVTLEESFAKAEISNTQLKNAKLEAREAEIFYENAKLAGNRIDEDHVNNYELAKKKYVLVRQAQAQAYIANSNVELLKKRLNNDVEKAYYAVMYGDALIQLNNKALERANSLLAVAEASYKAEVVPKSDVLGAQVQVNQAQAELLASEKGLEEARMNLAHLIGLPLDTQIETTKEMTFTPVEIDLESSIAEAVQNREEVKQAEQMLKAKELELEVAKKFFTSSVYEYQQKQIEVEKQKTIVEDKKTEVELEVRKAYLNVQNAKERYFLLQKGLEYAKENERISILRYKAGVTTNVEVITAQLSLNQVETDVAKALLDYNLAVREFYFAVGK